MQQKHKLVLTLVISVVIHILLFGLLYISKQSKTQLQDEVQPSPISATLYYYSPPVAVEVEPPQLESQQTQPEQIAAEVLPALEENEEEETELVEQQTPMEPPHKEMVQNTAPPEPQITQEPVESVNNNQYKQPVQDLVKGQLYNYQQDKLDKLAKQAAKDYRQQLNSPAIVTKPQDPFLTEDEKLEQKLTTSVDCSSTTNQTVFAVMKLLGGKVKCSEPPPIDSFIQKRLNKTAELPALEQ